MAVRRRPILRVKCNDEQRDEKYSDASIITRFAAAIVSPAKTVAVVVPAADTIHTTTHRDPAASPTLA